MMCRWGPTLNVKNIQYIIPIYIYMFFQAIFLGQNIMNRVVGDKIYYLIA